MLRSAQEGIGLRLELLDADPLVGGKDTSQERPHVGVVARVVLGEHRPEPAIVALVRRLPGLTAAQPGVVPRHLIKPTENEVSLDRQRLLTPQGAVVVEG
jgi:hypothetical protein